MADKEYQYLVKELKATIKGDELVSEIYAESVIKNCPDGMTCEEYTISHDFEKGKIYAILKLKRKAAKTTSGNQQNNEAFKTYDLTKQIP